MTWNDFVAQLGRSKQLTIIGPRYRRIHTATTPTVFVDGGTEFRPVADVESQIPTISVGDGDSWSGPLEHTLPKDKDFSDLAFVMRSLPPQITHLDLMGFLGGRRDHELFNLGEAAQFLSRGTAASLHTVRFDDQITGFCGTPVQLELNGRFSVMVLESSLVTIEGACRFPLAQATPLTPLSSYGLSNEGFGLVTIDSLKPCFVLFG